MSVKKPAYSKAFHSFLIYFFLWACAVFAILYGIKFISEGQMNGYNGGPLVLLIIVNVLLIALGVFMVKVRFDLAAFHAKAPKEILFSCLAGAVLCLANYWVQDLAEDDMNRSLLSTALILVCWGIVLYRYFARQEDLFIQ